jgi:hypothetical protein
MPKQKKLKAGEIRVPRALVVRMADRLWRLRSKARRDSFVARAKKRQEGGTHHMNDAAVVLAAGG